MFTIDADLTDNAVDFDDMYACFEVVYRDRADTEGSGKTAHDELYIVSNSKVDLAAPEIESVTLDRMKYDVSHIGEEMKLMVEFNEEVEVVRTADNFKIPEITVHIRRGSLNTAILFQLVEDKDKDNRLSGDIIASGTTLVFARTMYLGDSYVEWEDVSLVWTQVSLVDLAIRDAMGNKFTFTDAALSEAHDIAKDTITDMTPGIEITRRDDKLVASIDPAIVTFWPNNPRSSVHANTWMYRMSKVNPGNEHCLEIDADGVEEDDDYISSLMTVADGMITLPEDANNAWYCFTVDIGTTPRSNAAWIGETKNREGHQLYTNWYQYKADTDSPRLISVNHSEDSESLVVKASDTSGIKEIAWSILAQQNDPCVAQLTFTNVLDLAEADGVFTATLDIDKDIDGIWICMRATDNLNKHTVQKIQLMTADTEEDMPEEDSAEEDMPEEDVTPSDTPSTIDPENDETDVSDVGMNTVSVPSNWSDLSLLDQLELNPYQCTPNIDGIILFSIVDAICLPGSPSALSGNITVVTGDAEPIISDSVGDITADIPVDESEESEDNNTGDMPSGESEESEEPAADVSAVNESENNEGDEDQDDENDGSPTGIIIIVVILIVIVGIMLVSSNRKNN